MSFGEIQLKVSDFFAPIFALSILSISVVQAKDFKEESFEADPWMFEMNCSAKGLDFAEASFKTYSRANSLFGAGIKVSKVSWISDAGKQWFDLIYRNPASFLALRASFEVPEVFPAHPSDIVPGMKNPNPGSLSFNLPWMSYGISRKSSDERAVSSFFGFTDPMWLVTSSKADVAEESEKKRVAVSASGTNLSTGRNFSLECGGVFVLLDRDVNPVDPDMEMLGSHVYVPVMKGGRRLGKMVSPKRLSEWEEENK